MPSLGGGRPARAGCTVPDHSHCGGPHRGSLVRHEPLRRRGPPLCISRHASRMQRMHAGTCDAGSYPLQKKRHTLEFLRGIAHLRARTNTISAVARVRSALAQATHDFFSSQGFLYVHTPIISTSDCEGAGEMFQVRLCLASRSGHACTCVSSWRASTRHSAVHDAPPRLG